MSSSGLYAGCSAARANASSDSIAAGAAGVHVRSDGPPAARLRALGPAGAWVIGRSCHADDASSVAAGADYVLFGAVFATTSKPGATAAGIDALAHWCRATDVPVVAIGGLTPRGAEACAAAGAAGAAAIGAFLPEGQGPDAIGTRRAVPAFRAAIEAFPDDVVVLVGHDSVNRGLLLQLLDQPLSTYWKIAQDPCCINVIECRNGLIRVLAVNDTRHIGKPATDATAQRASRERSTAA